MRVLALIESDNHVCFRYRIGALRSQLAERGGQLDTLVLAGGVLPFYRQLKAIAQADVVILQRRLLAWWKLKLLRSAAKRLVYDIDDAVFLRDSNSTRPPHCPRRWRRFQATVQAADLVMAGNQFLVEHALACLPTGASDRVRHMPTFVDPSHYALAQHTKHGADATLVWIGSRSTMASLTAAQGTLTAAAAQLGRLNLKVICDDWPRLAGVHVIACPWTAATESHAISTSDMGISWLPEHPWSAGKCGLKVLQYMAAGLPVVANPVAMHKRLVIDGETGFLASSPSEWSQSIARLAASPALRRTLGQAARQLVEGHYSTNAWASSWVDPITALPKQMRCAA